ncbi:hypothetical protein AWM75_01200 [Aerococcus urinaehominis]|uniref:Smf/DprA SLOG domain-containing protein n=1 Tax=Aerococcus urinaehominis TaxID=128944 RepID=A0A109RGB4_9LACT|nr:DNA-processing protein DprA [Aerococcus urinaehominis]AMB98693.1 hypothetical protein AWM75_01200 [Aerococcus urinaehominis]SDL98897.1 DNA processing protein [Aerococcus urinaehominis]
MLNRIVDYLQTNYTSAHEIYVHSLESGLFSYQDREALVAIYRNSGLNIGNNKQSLASDWHVGGNLQKDLTTKQLNDLARKVTNLGKLPDRLSWPACQAAYADQNIQAISLDQAQYPELLRASYQPAQVLFCQGDWRLLHTPQLAVVGSRDLTPYGYQALSRLLPPVLSAWTITSGLAKGADVTAHQEAVKGKGRTIAVIGTGLNHAYPRHHKNIQAQLAKDQLVVSPLPCQADVQRWHFPYRNRVIAGLSLACLVVQAKEKSGTLITAHHALNENRQVLAIPGPITDAAYAGSNRLIQEGASLVASSEDLLAALPSYF